MEMSTEQTAIDGFREYEDDQEASESDDVTTRVLFRLSDDPFVNEAAAEMGRQLANEELADINPATIETSPEADPGDVVTAIKKLFNYALTNTHRRKTVSYQLNGTIEDIGQGPDDDRWVPPPDTYFPNQDGDQTIYADDQVDIETLNQNGIPPDEFEYIDEDSSRLYELSPIYVGHPSGNKFGSQIGRYERYLETYNKTVSGEFDSDDHACMLCGSEKMPTTKGIDDKNLEFNQSFDIRSTSSAVSRPLGMGGRTSAHSGRCVACLIAGFYYTLMSKVVRYKDREECGGNFPIPVYRVFTPRGDFESLAGIRGDFDTDLLEWIDTPTENNYARRGTLPVNRTKSRGMQTIQFYESVLRHANTVREQDYYDFTVRHRPTALISYTSAKKKSGNPIRDIREIEKLDPDEWAYAAVEKRSITDGEGEEEYWPYEDVINWYTRIEEWYMRSNQDGPVAVLDDISYGILRRDLKRLARGQFEIAKILEQEQGENAPYIPPIKKTASYFNDIMQQIAQDKADRIDEKDINSIKRVASNVGEAFYERDDISVLIAFQNSSTPDEFLKAFEKAGMQAQKKASSNEGSNNWSGKDDVATVLQLINNPETFEPTKRMFVIHASLSAQYMNAQRHDGGGD
jgi:hypothetical protein